MPTPPQQTQPPALDPAGAAGSTACSVDGSGSGASSRLNQSCFCVTLDAARLQQELQRRLPESAAAALAQRPQLFANSPLFVSAADLQAMTAVVQAIEAVVRLPAYRRQVLAAADAVAQLAPGPQAVFMGYDFHLGADGPQLIEINTNAGGAFLNACLASAQWACCDFMQPTGEPLTHFESRVLDMFLQEWRLQRGARRLRRIAIVDEAPETQFLYPEFQLAQSLFQRAGIEAEILDPQLLWRENGQLLSAAGPIDLVYNRLTDFLLRAPQHAALRDAYLSGEVVLTPHPQAWALYANKRNLALLSNAELLGQWGLAPREQQILARAVPATFDVHEADRERLWRERNRLFFKPVSGHGSRGVYRGAKLTRAVFERILRDGYVAQRYAPPGERHIAVDGVAQPLKADVRLYTYAGDVLLQAARLYAGQATNLRTRGGGFAAVFQTD